MEWNIDPILFSIGPISIRWYGLFFTLGFIAGYLFIRHVFLQEKKTEADLDTLFPYMVISTLIGARLGHCLFYNPRYYFLEHPIEILMIRNGGLASHGGAIGILCGLYLYSRHRPQQTYLWLLDRLAIPVAFSGCLIRIGNLFNSEIIGIPSDVPWAFTFTLRGDLMPILPRHPVQLYESIAYGMICIVLFKVYRRYGAETPRGLLTGLFLITVFSSRFLIEFLKVPQAMYAENFVLSVGQILSIPAIPIGCFLLWGVYTAKKAVVRRT